MRKGTSAEETGGEAQTANALTQISCTFGRKCRREEARGRRDRCHEGKTTITDIPGYKVSKGQSIKGLTGSST